MMAVHKVHPHKNTTHQVMVSDLPRTLAWTSPGVTNPSEKSLYLPDKKGLPFPHTFGDSAEAAVGVKDYFLSCQCKSVLKCNSTARKLQNSFVLQLKQENCH